MIVLDIQSCIVAWFAWVTHVFTGGEKDSDWRSSLHWLTLETTFTHDNYSICCTFTNSQKDCQGWNTGNKSEVQERAFSLDSRKWMVFKGSSWAQKRFSCFSLLQSLRQSLREKARKLFGFFSGLEFWFFSPWILLGLCTLPSCQCICCRMYGRVYGMPWSTIMEMLPPPPTSRLPYSSSTFLFCKDHRYSLWTPLRLFFQKQSERHYISKDLWSKKDRRTSEVSKGSRSIFEERLVLVTQMRFCRVFQLQNTGQTLAIKWFCLWVACSFTLLSVLSHNLLVHGLLVPLVLLWREEVFPEEIWFFEIIKGRIIRSPSRRLRDSTFFLLDGNFAWLYCCRWSTCPEVTVQVINRNCRRKSETTKETVKEAGESMSENAVSPERVLLFLSFWCVPHFAVVSEAGWPKRTKKKLLSQY